MGCLDRLLGGRFTQLSPDEPPLSDAAIMRELHPFRGELKAFTQNLLARLPEKEQARLVRRVIHFYGHGEEPSSALTGGLLDPDKGQALEQLVLLAINWNGFDGFEYLAPCLTNACGIRELYRQCEWLTVVQVLAEFDEWLTRFGKRYVHLITGGDEYVGFIMDTDGLDIMIAMAKKAGIEARLEAF
ncbi:MULTISPECIES: DUF6630 family protein [Pseudomonas]|uniref:DUF6630 domain-containing protein n=3 Tax=Pseudomonas syringae TaxID=317 RepID=F3GF78_PSESJ|nr:MULTISPECIES: hypothetical protein [Pseudomonas]EGH45728.1 hypothetical protein PSYPI_26844 [Pseudomonas syringae pv. pisi str. 1704B]MBI6673880.1 hypothetical protein [Pseudomonas syringae]MBP1084636.1 hypothetical protein [Pseudomonas sp. PvP007]MBP1194326.1 hypothetical protein [Pseudomonas sp. PvP100]MBS7473512.1 hypothetical protein [Pseudomonas syringae]